MFIVIDVVICFISFEISRIFLNSLLNQNNIDYSKRILNFDYANS